MHALVPNGTLRPVESLVLNMLSCRHVGGTQSMMTPYELRALCVRER